MTLPLTSRIALVTGASRGIGYATARALAKAGAHVIAVARTVGGLEELDDRIRAIGGTATLVPVDMKDMDGIARLALAIHDRYKRLDVMVGNAGILGTLSPLPHAEPKDFDNIFAVNVKANWQLIRTMDPLLQASPAGRAVFISSALGWMGRARGDEDRAAGIRLPEQRLHAADQLKIRGDVDGDDVVPRLQFDVAQR